MKVRSFTSLLTIFSPRGQLRRMRSSTRASVKESAETSLSMWIATRRGPFWPSKAGAELLFDVIATAYERNSLIVTTNLPFENWTEVLGSERLTGAALDRLTHRCHILETKGESYRLRDAKRRCRRSG